MYGAIGCLALGGLTLVNWGFAMFSDHWYADLLRAQSKTWFNLGRNTESVITPSIGMFCVLGGFGSVSVAGVDVSGVAAGEAASSGAGGCSG